MANFPLFLRACLNEPRRVAAIAPSGRALAERITAEITPSSAPVIELGPGTGVFTELLLERGVPETALALIECDPGFARDLQRRFPHARLLAIDADKLGSARLFGAAAAGAVISGLPLLSMSPRKVIAILDGAFRHLRIGGAFYQFTYGPVCPVPRPILDRLGLKAVGTGWTLANLPPASVYRISRRAPHRWAGRRADHAETRGQFDPMQDVSSSDA